MKVYLFDPETGLFQGEDFADEEPLRMGHHAVPAHATIVAPPPFGRGEVPVFNVAEQQWHIVPTQLVRADGEGEADEPGKLDLAADVGGA